MPTDASDISAIFYTNDSASWDAAAGHAAALLGWRLARQLQRHLARLKVFLPIVQYRPMAEVGAPNECHDAGPAVRRQELRRAGGAAPRAREQADAANRFFGPEHRAGET